jgi:hypothetical protein
MRDCPEVRSSVNIPLSVEFKVLPQKIASWTSRPQMSKFACTCGNIITDVQCPNEVTGWLLSDKSGDAFFTLIREAIDDYCRHLANDDVERWRQKHFNDIYPTDLSAGHMIHDVLTNHFFRLTLAVMECDNCGRIWVQQKPDVNHYHGYCPDDLPQARPKLLGMNRAGPTPGCE